jgi:hypothetical protein
VTFEETHIAGIELKLPRITILSLDFDHSGAQRNPNETVRVVVNGRLPIWRQFQVEHFHVTVLKNKPVNIVRWRLR